MKKKNIFLTLFILIIILSIYTYMPSNNDFVYTQIYNINGEKLEYTEDIAMNEDEDFIFNLKEPTLEEKQSHELLWSYIDKILPTRVKKYIVYFEIGTDGKDELLAAALAIDDNLDKWALDIDIEDALYDNKIDYILLNENITHEIAHILTLNNTQIDPNSKDKNTYITTEGVCKKDSYLNIFYNKFWKDRYEDYLLEEDSYDSVKIFENYEENFVSEYAATNVEEDIAESFRVFILEDKPLTDTERDKKVKFFYNYKDLIKIRDYIRNHINEL